MKQTIERRGRKKQDYSVYNFEEIEKYLENYTKKDAVDKFNISLYKLNILLKINGYEERSNNKSEYYNFEDKDFINELKDYIKNNNKKKAAEKYNFSVYLINKCIRDV